MYLGSLLIVPAERGAASIVMFGPGQGPTGRDLEETRLLSDKRSLRRNYESYNTCCVIPSIYFMNIFSVNTHLVFRRDPINELKGSFDSQGCLK